MPTFRVYVSYTDKHSGRNVDMTHTTTCDTPDDARRMTMNKFRPYAEAVVVKKTKLVRRHS